VKNTVGKSREKSDWIDPARAAAMQATLGQEGPFLVVGDRLPAFWHQIYFWDAVAPDSLGPDGHPRTGTFLPDTGLARRMWGGGDLTFHAPLLIGQAATRRSTVLDARRKTGRSGALAFVTIRHEVVQNDRICLTEHQNLIYRAKADPNSPTPAAKLARRDETRCRPADFSTTLLFRYSALTFNGHRIHYDRDYCQRVEGYPGLVVHGPLLAQLLVALAEDMDGPLAKFTFRATAPLFDFESAEICGAEGATGLDLWVRGSDGRLVMEATSCAT